MCIPSRGLPVLIVMVFFAIVAGSSEIVQNTNSCSCWCAPVLGNVLPYAIHREKVDRMRKPLTIDYI